MPEERDIIAQTLWFSASFTGDEALFLLGSEWIAGTAGKMRGMTFTK